MVKAWQAGQTENSISVAATAACPAVAAISTVAHDETAGRILLTTARSLPSRDTSRRTVSPSSKKAFTSALHRSANQESVHLPTAHAGGMNWTANGMPGSASHLLCLRGQHALPGIILHSQGGADAVAEPGEPGVRPSRGFAPSGLVPHASAPMSGCLLRSHGVIPQRRPIPNKLDRAGRQCCAE